MRVRIVVPGKTFLDQEVDKITAPGTEGFFQMLPKHIDVVSSLQAGILTLTKDDEDKYYAINQGVLVKQGATVYISCLQAIEGATLEDLKKRVEDSFRNLDEKEKRLNQILSKFEAETLIRFIDLH